MDSSGLSDLLIDSGVHGENACHVLLSGKAYNRGVRAYKLTYEALWRVYFAKVKQWQQDCNMKDKDSVKEMLCLAEKVSDAFKPKIKDTLKKPLRKFNFKLHHCRYLKILTVKISTIQRFYSGETT